MGRAEQKAEHRSRSRELLFLVSVKAKEKKPSLPERVGTASCAAERGTKPSRKDKGRIRSSERLPAGPLPTPCPYQSISRFSPRAPGVPACVPSLATECSRKAQGTGLAPGCQGRPRNWLRIAPPVKQCVYLARTRRYRQSIKKLIRCFLG